MHCAISYHPSAIAIRRLKDIAKRKIPGAYDDSAGRIASTNLQTNNKMFVRMLTVHCDQNNSYEITLNGFQVRKINEIRNAIFGLRYGNPPSTLRLQLGCSPS